MVSRHEHPVKPALAQLIRNSRDEKGWNGSRLAHEAGVAKATLWKIENGDTTPSLPTLARIVRALEIDVAQVARLIANYARRAA